MEKIYSPLNGPGGTLQILKASTQKNIKPLSAIYSVPWFFFHVPLLTVSPLIALRGDPMPVHSGGIQASTSLKLSTEFDGDG